MLTLEDLFPTCTRCGYNGKAKPVRWYDTPEGRIPLCHDCAA